MFEFNLHEWLKLSQLIGARYFVLASVAFLIFYVLFPKRFSNIKIQQKFPKLNDYTRDVFFSIISIAIFATMAYVFMIVLKDYNHVHYGSIKEYGTVFFILSFIWLFFLHDFYFYWMHRLMHTKLLFRTVHLIHHKSTNPSPWTAYAFHPLEAIFEAGIIPLIVFTLPIHKIAFVLFMLFQIIYNVYGHLGYEIMPRKLSRSPFGMFLNTSTNHNEHHKYFKGNYGLYTRFWDRLWQTKTDIMQHHKTGGNTSEMQHVLVKREVLTDADV